MAMKILVVDDSSTMRSVAESSLRQKGYEVLLADGIQKGLEIMKYNKPDLIFLDYSLPDIDCGAMCRRLKKEEQSKDAPLVVLLSSAETNKKTELTECGAEGFVVKPFTAKELTNIIEELSAKKDAKIASQPQPEESNQSPVEEENPVEDKIEVDAMLMSSFQTPTAPKKDRFEETSVSLDLGNIQFPTVPVEENIVSPDSLSDSSKIETVPDSNSSHDYEWFVSEIKKDMQENGEEKAKPEPEVIAEDSSIDYMTKITLDDKEEPKAPSEEKKTTGNNEFEQFVSEFKKEMEGTSFDEKDLDTLPTREEKAAEEKTETVFPKSPDYDELTNRLVDEISRKIAQQIAEKIDREFLKQMIEKHISEK